jgi:hypothetical protein
MLYDGSELEEAYFFSFVFQALPDEFHQRLLIIDESAWPENIVL